MHPAKEIKNLVIIFWMILMLLSFLGGTQRTAAEWETERLKRFLQQQGVQLECDMEQKMVRATVSVDYTDSVWRWATRSQRLCDICMHIFSQHRFGGMMRVCGRVQNATEWVETEWDGWSYTTTVKTSEGKTTTFRHDGGNSFIRRTVEWSAGRI